jgi:WD40 repeat protein
LWVAYGPEIQGRKMPTGEVASSWTSAVIRWQTGSSDPKCLAVGRRWVVGGADNGHLYLLRCPDASQVALPQVSDSAVRRVALNADETLAVAGTDGGGLCLLRLADRSVAARMTPHRDQVVALAFAGSSLLASGSRDRTVRLWHVTADSLSPLVTLPMPGPVRWLGFHPDGVRLFVLLERESAVRIWHLDRLRDQLEELGLGAGLELIQKAELPPPIELSAPAPVEELPQGPNGLRAELFVDSFLYQCVKVRYDPAIDFHWGEGSPDSLLPHEDFSVRWSGWLKAPTPGRYMLELDSDDGARLWLNGKLRISYWWLSPGRHAVEVDLGAEPQALRVEYFQRNGPRHVRLSWALAGRIPLQPIPSSALFHELAGAQQAVVPLP